MSKPRVFTRDDIVACADEVIGMSGGYNDAFNAGVLELAGYLLDIPPEDVVDLMHYDASEDNDKADIGWEDRSKLDRIGTDCGFATEILEREKDPDPTVNHLCREMRWIAELATTLINEKYGISQ